MKLPPGNGLPMLPVKDGYLKFLGYKVYFKIFGESTKGKLPLLILAGGPGSAHNYLLDLQWLAKSGRQVVFYDQLGSGRSDRPENDSLYVIKTYVDEINAVRKQLNLKEVHILGQSWGGMLAIEYMLSRPNGVHSLILASSMISIKLYMDELKKLKARLPGNTYKILTEHEKNDTTDSEEYQQSYSVYKSHHLYRPGKLPRLLQGGPNTFGSRVYNKMWGPSEAYANGTLKNWDKINDLKKIKVPTLITSGKYDELTPSQAEMTQKEIKDSQRVLFEHSAHLPHAEEPEKYRQVVENFLEKIEN